VTILLNFVMIPFGFVYVMHRKAYIEIFLCRFKQFEIRIEPRYTTVKLLL